MKSTSHIPQGYNTVTPYFHAADPRKLIEFLKTVFDAEEKDFAETPDGGVMHASYRVGNSMIELAGASEKWPAMPAAVHIYVPDTDATYQKALDAGATSLQPPADMFYGERGACVRDSEGNNWYIATKTEDLTQEEMDARTAAHMQGQQQQ